MIDMYYDAYAVAYYLYSYCNEMGCKSQMGFLERLYADEYEFLNPNFKKSKRRFFSEVFYAIHYLYDYESLDEDLRLIERDFKVAGRLFNRDSVAPDEQNSDLPFMILRLRILYENDRKYVRMKLKKLLDNYGYKRRTDYIITHLRDCFMFYHVQPYLRGEKVYDIRDVRLDDMLTFRLADEMIDGETGL